MGPEIIVLIMLLVLILFLLSFYIGAYNSLIKANNKVKESSSSIDVNLKLRYDLIPNLNRIVKNYSEHEKEILNKLIESRKNYNNSDDLEEKIGIANGAKENLTSLVMRLEKYPELKADKLYSNFSKSLAEIEEKISAARRFNNATINHYNNKVLSFPTNIIAKKLKYKTKEYFKIESVERNL